MALREPYMVKRITAAEGGDLEADAGESLLIKDIYCEPIAADTYLTIRVDKVLCAYYRVKGLSGNHLAYPHDRPRFPTIMGYLAAKGAIPFIPVAEGQALNVSRAVGAGDVTLVYEIHDAGDITPVMPNGSAAMEYVFLNYCTNEAAIAADGDFLLDKILCPAELPDFPIGKDVPAKTRISILGIAGAALGFKLTAALGETSYLKLIRGRDTLHDEDRDGLVFEGAVQAGDATEYTPETSVIGPLTFEHPEEPLWFPEPLVFEPGEELNPYVTIKGAADAGITKELLDVAFIEHVAMLA